MNRYKGRVFNIESMIITWIAKRKSIPLISFLAATISSMVHVYTNSMSNARIFYKAWILAYMAHAGFRDFAVTITSTTS